MGRRGLTGPGVVEQWSILSLTAAPFPRGHGDRAMATAPMTTNGTLSDRIGDWFSHEAIDFLDSLGTEIDCRVEAFAAKVSDRVREAALQMAHAGVTTLLIDRGVRPTPTPETDAPTQNVLQLPTQRGGTPKGAAPAAPTASPAAAGTRAPRAPREGGIAAEIKAHLAAHP